MERALLLASYILNRVLPKDREKTSFEFWKGYSFRLSYFRVWRCLAKVKIFESKRVKIGSKTVDAIFVGYSLDSNTYKFSIFNSEIPSISNNIIIESKDATFFKNIFFKNSDF